ncbi:hypothetical protein EJ03DRAFT_332508 [Teratosphaeria nubilosa]|uniref:Opioid growth factor receptor (OGFr) conserved domain-containing protein n=1 Tax=Teratosphaeria nubilosa TaxID=161662 RepID=A0A6G1KTG0_9PEZI|nr:hypothetical protein EJ03DRAFT_332508 [Teratosphaeria nubilosa]
MSAARERRLPPAVDAGKCSSPLPTPSTSAPHFLLLSSPPNSPAAQHYRLAIASISPSQHQLPTASPTQTFPPMATSPHPIVAFFHGTISAPFDPINPRTTLNDVLLWDDATLEDRHDYIQHLFPLPEPSTVNPRAPIITMEVRDAFVADPGLRSRLLEASNRMFRFYCLDDIPETPNDSPSKDEHYYATRATIEDTRSPFVQAMRAKIAKHHDHNHLRLTRMIRCLRVLACVPISLDPRRTSTWS